VASITYPLKSLPPTLHEVVENFLKKHPPEEADSELFKRLFEDLRSKKLWDEFAKLPEKTRNKKTVSFISIAPEILSSAKRNKITPKAGNFLRLSPHRSKSAISKIHGIAATAVKHGMLDEQRYSSIQKRLNYIQGTLDKSFKKSDGSAFLAALYGEEYSNVGNFTKRGSPDAEDIFITKALSIFFKKCFGIPHHSLSSIISLVMRGQETPANTNKTLLGDRARKRNK
jgi:hypothetical protein